MPMPFAERVSVVALLELQQRQPQLLDRVEGADPEQLPLSVPLSVRMNRSATPLPSGSRTNAGLGMMPRNFRHLESSR